MCMRGEGCNWVLRLTRNDRIWDNTIHGQSASCPDAGCPWIIQKHDTNASFDANKDANSPCLHGKLAVFTRQIRRIYTANSPYLHGKLAEFAVLLSASGKTILPLAPIPLLYPYADTGGEPQAGLRYVAEVDIVLLVQEVVHLREYGVCRLAPRQSRVDQ